MRRNSSPARRRVRRPRPHWMAWCSNRRKRLARLSGDRTQRRRRKTKKERKPKGRSAARRLRSRRKLFRAVTQSIRSLTAAFQSIKDPRVNRRRRHALLSIIVIPLLAVMGGANCWKGVQIWAASQASWLSQWLPLPNGVPSRDTYRRLYDRLCPDALCAAFLNWTQELSRDADGRLIAIDGKTLRGSKDSELNSPLLHLVSAWATERHLTLGQVAVDGKSNEITAIPVLLKTLDLHGAIVTIDAMGCQKGIARDIRQGGGDYVLALKENHQLLYADVDQAFSEQVQRAHAESGGRFYHQEETSHGRQQDRTYLAMRAPAWLHGRKDWKGLKSIVMVLESQGPNGTEPPALRYFLTSLPPDATILAKAIRRHWSIENSLHWVLDVTFREDHSRMGPRTSTTNFALLRRVAIGLLKNEPTIKDTVNAKRQRAAWDVAYLEKVLLTANGPN